MANNNQSQKKKIARLEYQIKLVNAQLEQVTSSRGYKAVRTLGNAKNEFKRSPQGFVKKVTKKVLKRTAGGTLRGIDIKITAKNSIDQQYRQWMSFNEPDTTELAEQKRLSDKFEQQPLISIVTPVFNPPVDVLAELVESVLAQTYPHFELLLGDFGDKQDVADLLTEYAGKDTRVKYRQFSENKGIAANSNQILEMVEGEFIALLDHDDTLSPDALYENVKCINATQADFVFSDKDKIDVEGNRFDPFFKPGWSPDIMLNANYLTHLNVMRTSKVKEVGGWSSDTDGAQDWDLFLKIVATTEKIQHIPKVLYHWRIIETSTALSIETKPYALKGQRVAIDKYLDANKIPANTYHSGAEALLRWDNTDKPVHLIVSSTSKSQTLSFLADAQKFLENDNDRLQITVIGEKPVGSASKAKWVEIGDSYLQTLAIVLAESEAAEVILINDIVSLKVLEMSDIDDIRGWLDIPEVATAFPRVIDEEGFAMDCGASIALGVCRPLFAGVPDYFQSPQGNIEWIRNVSVGTPVFMAVKTRYLADILTDLKATSLELAPEVLSAAVYLKAYSRGQRNLFNPKLKVKLTKSAQFDVEGYYDEISSILAAGIPDYDRYYNPNIDAEDPMAITPIRQHEDVLSDDQSLISDYSVEAMVHTQNILISDEDLEKSFAHIEKTAAEGISSKNPSFMFILPGFTGIYAGLNNIFSYAQAMKTRGSKISFVLLINEAAVEEHRKLVAEKFPELADAAIYASSVSDTDGLPACDIAVCTQWATAYTLAVYNKCLRKCYFIQDKEASFYPKGSISALVDNTYKFGFFAIANTPGLLDWYQTEYGGEGVTLKSKVDLDIYAPPETLNVEPKKPYKIFFYARPNEPRNAFELGASALRIVKDELGDMVEIYGAGSYWRPEDYDLEGVVDNLGKVSYDELPSFYRSMDVGLMFMFSGHPGVVASELMASGCPVVVNRYDDETWNTLYRNEYNCLVSLSTAKSIAESTIRLLKDADLRSIVIPNALITTKAFYSGYDEACDATLKTLSAPLS